MKNLTTKITLFICSILLSFQALAHVDHALGDGEFHMAYHIAFYALLALVVFKGYGWLKVKKANKKKD
ncbi:hypothetical protein L0668_07435 [Paraglaciecola aquimarina]|uniref:Uncharacterized protein n=1 Tax=Paraglaciecola algarum TaxID=3050085 RepID=A0ABS9D7D9_9ALTE|nr:hypothetical protein [Paraglaciecola sp. G1-23]MCF2947933.1 hypothetical protein [Paraglaciecola sp. G1-23]